MQILVVPRQEAGGQRAYNVLLLPRMPPCFYLFPPPGLLVVQTPRPPFQSTASFKSDIVLSMLRLRVLGLVVVVPKLACRPWPRRNGVTDPEPVRGEPAVGVWGLIGLDGELENVSSSAASTPFGESSRSP